MINLNAYFTIGTIVFVLEVINFIIQDLKYDGYLSLEGLIRDISEGLIVGLSWIISIPILIVTNILLTIIYMICSGEDEDE
ncbi:MAG: hypothetical protein MSS80_08135 [Mollicutes bacterium]|nr:hypothetical protein [Mollicutes bacterium]